MDEADKQQDDEMVRQEIDKLQKELNQQKQKVFELNRKLKVVEEERDQLLEDMENLKDSNHLQRSSMIDSENNQP